MDQFPAVDLCEELVNFSHAIAGPSLLSMGLVGQARGDSLRPAHVAGFFRRVYPAADPLAQAVIRSSQSPTMPSANDR